MAISSICPRPSKATFPVGHNGPPGAYVGTSISSAVVANALAQYLNRNPGATPASAFAALSKSPVPRPAPAAMAPASSMPPPCGVS